MKRKKMLYIGQLGMYKQTKGKTAETGHEGARGNSRLVYQILYVFSASNFYPNSRHDHHLSTDENTDHVIHTPQQSYVNIINYQKFS
jgi:hypothetical protein